MSDAISVRGRVRTVTIVSSEKPTRGAPGKRPVSDDARSGGREPVRDAQMDECDVRSQAPSAEEVYEQAFQSGYESGREETRREVQQECDDRLARELKRVDTFLGSLQEQSEKIRRQSEHAIIRLSLAIAGQIVKQEVVIDREIVIRQLRESLRKVVGVEKITVRVNPADEALVRERRAGMLAGAETVHDMIIESDDKIEVGGCIIESDLGNIDARLTSQLKRIEEALMARETHASSVK